ncbi:MAG: hypothetical protein KR126chlam6_00279 [Candidatus Anoxychlamydiales bacterium]|nr:hypothetical protein [Candidatus Anoxychlamydiales bacterium]
MKKIAVLLILFVSFCSAQILEVKNIKETKKHLKKYDLVLLDLDNTVMEPVQQLASDQWFFHQMKSHQVNGLDFKKALDQTLSQWYEVQAITKVRLVEQDIKDLIEKLQNKNTLIMGLTTRGVELSLAAIKQLDSLDIDLLKTAPRKEKIYFETGSFYNKGILFANGINKGKVLESFFKKIEFYPKSIVFIDDKLHHLNEVKTFCSDANIKFLGLRYGYLDEKVKNFDKTISDVQYKNLKNIISDKDAKKMIE